MADTNITCKQCGFEMRVSEYVKTDSITCKECGTAVVVKNIARSARASLNIKPPDPSEPPSLMKPSESTTYNLARDVQEEKKHQRRMPKKVWGLVTFLLLSLALLLGIWLSKLMPQTMVADVYLAGRWVVMLAVFLLLCMDAFSEGYLQGILCLLLLPFTVYYGLTSSDYYPLRGAFAALIVAVVVEVWLIPDQSLLTHANDVAAAVVDFGQDNIRRAGEAPTY